MNLIASPAPSADARRFRFRPRWCGIPAGIVLVALEANCRAMAGFKMNDQAAKAYIERVLVCGILIALTQPWLQSPRRMPPAAHSAHLETRRRA